MLDGKAGSMCHTEWFMQITGSHSSVVEDRGLLGCDYVTFPDILKDRCVCILRGKQSNNQSSPLGLPTHKLLVPELFFLISAHPLYKMWIIQEPNTLELWNKLQFEEEETESIYHV